MAPARPEAVRSRRDARGRGAGPARRGRSPSGTAGRADPVSCFCWWDLPPGWRAETFVAAAARRGITVTPAAAFTTGTGAAPRAVRLGLASPPLETLAHALDVLAGIAAGTPDDTLVH